MVHQMCKTIITKHGAELVGYFTCHYVKMRKNMDKNILAPNIGTKVFIVQ